MYFLKQLLLANVMSRFSTAQALSRLPQTAIAYSRPTTLVFSIRYATQFEIKSKIICVSFDVWSVV